MQEIKSGLREKKSVLWVINLQLREKSRGMNYKLTIVRKKVIIARNKVIIVSYKFWIARKKSELRVINFWEKHNCGKKVGIARQSHNCEL